MFYKFSLITNSQIASFVRSKAFEKLTLVLLFLSFLTSSWDIFGTLTIDGYTFRVCALTLSMLMGLSIIKIKSDGFFYPAGFFWLLAACLVNWLACFKDGLYKNEIAHALWFTFLVGGYFFVPNLVASRKILKNTLVLYMASFFILSVFGFFQLFLFLIFWKELFITQWIVPGVFPRVSGFSYEPSYYATYLITGWSLCYFYVCQEPNSKKILNWILYTVLAIGLAVSSSKGIIGGELLILLSGFLIIIFKPVFGFRRGSVIAATGFGFAAFFLYLSLAFSVIGSKPRIQEDIKPFLQGTGLIATGSHSVAARWDSTGATFDVFKENYLIGVSFGGIPYKIAKVNGETIQDYEDFKANQGNSVLIECLAALGAFGFFCLCGCFFNIVRALWGPKRLVSPKVAVALVGALIVSLIALQFNQNLFRFYFWLFIYVMAASGSKNIVLYLGQNNLKA